MGGDSATRFRGAARISRPPRFPKRKEAWPENQNDLLGKLQASFERDCECGHALADHRSRSSNCEAAGCECELYEPEHVA